MHLRDIARRQEMSKKYLEHLISRLEVAGLARSIRGAGGGISLARPPSEIRLSQIFQALEGPIVLVECVDNPRWCPRSSRCATRDIWMQMGQLLSAFLESQTLEDLCRQQREKEQPRTRQALHLVQLGRESRQAMMAGLSDPMVASGPQLDRIRGVEGLNPELCFSCRKCSAGCPVADDMDLAPHQLVGLTAAGLEGEALRSSGIWLCTSCQTCTTRCPNGVDVAGVIDALKQRAAAAGVKPARRADAGISSRFSGRSESPRPRARDDADGPLLAEGQASAGGHPAGDRDAPEGEAPPYPAEEDRDAGTAPPL